MTGIMIDVTGAWLPGLLTALEGRYPDTLGGYVTGTPDVDWPARYWQVLTGHVGLFSLDQSPGLNLFASGAANGADLEPGAATIAQAVTQTEPREKRGQWSTWYVSHQEEGYSLAEARGAASGAGLTRVRYFVADWDMSLAAATAFLAANGDVDAVQWASPKSNPGTTCPGTDKTLAELNVDLSVTRPGWFARTAPPAPPRTLSSVTIKFSDGSFVEY